jgi:hypothetical protein
MISLKSEKHKIQTERKSNDTPANFSKNHEELVRFRVSVPKPLTKIGKEHKYHFNAWATNIRILFKELGQLQLNDSPICRTPRMKHMNLTNSDRALHEINNEKTYSVLVGSANHFRQNLQCTTTPSSRFLKACELANQQQT